MKIDVIMEPWPNFTENQVAFLERTFPPRCIERNERLEDHLRYAGVVDLIARMKEHVIGSPESLVLSEDEEAALDDEALAIAQHQQGE